MEGMLFCSLRRPRRKMQSMNAAVPQGCFAKDGGCSKINRGHESIIILCYASLIYLHGWNRFGRKQSGDQSVCKCRNAKFEIIIGWQIAPQRVRAVSWR